MDNLENEIWKDIEGYVGLYQISNFGNVKRLENLVNHKELGHKQKLKEKILKQSIKKNGYKFINITKNKIKKNYYIHRLVALTFINNTENKLEVNHKNGIKSDNRVENLEWVTHSENHIHKIYVLYKKHKYSEESKRKMSESAKNKPKISEETRKKMSQAQINRQLNKQLK